MDRNQTSQVSLGMFLLHNDHENEQTQMIIPQNIVQLQRQTNVNNSICLEIVERQGYVVYWMRAKGRRHKLLKKQFKKNYEGKSFKNYRQDFLFTDLDMLAGPQNSQKFFELQIVRRDEYTVYWMKVQGKRYKLLRTQKKSAFPKQHLEDFQLLPKSQRTKLIQKHRKFYCRKCSKNIQEQTYNRFNGMGAVCCRKTHSNM